MASKRRVKFATQVDEKVLEEVRRLAADEGRQLQALVDEALLDLLEKRNATRPRAHVLAAYQGSHETFSGLYRKLAE